MGHYAHQSSGGYSYQPWQPQPKDATDEIWTQSTQWIQRISFQYADARQQTTAHPISSPGAFRSGELKQHKTCNG